MAHDVFISYSSKDKNIADAVCAKLEGEKIRCWIAPRDIPPGDSWAGTIVDAITDSKVFVLVFSDGANQSQQVIREVGEAVDNGIPIVPLRIEDVKPSKEMRYYIKSIHWLDAMTPPLQKHLQKLTHTVQALLAVEDSEIPEKENLPTQEPPAQEPPAQEPSKRKRPRLPIWAGTLIALAAIALIAGGTWWFTGKDRGTSSTPVVVITAEPTVAPAATEVILTETATPESAASLYEIGSTQVSPVDGMVMVYVPEGEFLMGMPAEEHFEDSAPVHNVYLDAFWIDQTEVTNAQYQQCVNEGACRSPWSTSSKDREEYYGNPQYDDYPLVYVDWDRAQAYCEWAGRRLPTEAEWEKAARGTDGRTYPWGDTFCGSCVNYCDLNCDRNHADNSWDDGYADTAPAGSYPSGASPYGVLDMSGNVGEWVADWYASDYYSISPYDNPQGPASGEYLVTRGSAYDSAERDMRVAGRSGGHSAYDESRGFRCAVTNPVISYINLQEIKFEDDFSTAKSEWGQTSEFSYLSEYVSNGVLSIADKLTNPDDSIIDGSSPGISFPINGMFDAADFSLQFDFSFISTVSSEALIGVRFRSPYDPDNAYDQKIGYALDISKDGFWTLKKDNNQTLIAEGEASLDPEYNTLQLIALDQCLGIFLNEELLYETSNLEGLEVSGRFTEIALFAPEGAIFKLDNVKYWNLEDVEIPSASP